MSLTTKEIFLVESFFSALWELSVANYLTGLWDNRRFQLCKKPYEEFTEEDKAYLYETEKNSRYNVEQRAVNRQLLEKTFTELVQYRRPIEKDIE